MSFVKRGMLLAFFFVTGTFSYSLQNYSRGNLLLGIGLGAGTASAYPLGSPQLTIHPSIELILAAWAPKKIGIALGLTIDSSMNFLGTGTTGTIAPMVTLHITFLPRLDWYTSLGMGLQLLPSSGTSGAYNVHVGFATGFNILLAPAFFLNMGLAIHADQFFGSVGLRIRFGDTSRIEYNARK